MSVSSTGDRRKKQPKNLTCLDDVRKTMIFQKGCQPHQLPPTSAALKHHSKRALFQAGHMWGKSLIACSMRFWLVKNGQW